MTKILEGELRLELKIDIHLSVKGIVREVVVTLKGVSISLIHDQAVFKAAEDLCLIN